MATQGFQSNSSGALNPSPSRQILRQLLEEINSVSSARTVRKSISLQSLAGARAPYPVDDISSSVWIGGSSLAQDAREKLRAADEAHWRRRSINLVEDNLKPLPPTLHLDTSGLEWQDTEVGTRKTEDGTHHKLSPDPIRDPHDHLQHVLRDSPLSTTAERYLAGQSDDSRPTQLQAPPLSSTVTRPLSPLMFSDVSYENITSSLPTEMNSPTETPTSATTTGTVEQPQPPRVDARKRAHFFDELPAEVSAQKRRTLTVPNIRNDSYFKLAPASQTLLGIGGDNRCVLRTEGFTERAPRGNSMAVLSLDDAIPELSSFRPNDPDPLDQPIPESPQHKLSRAHTSPTDTRSSELPDSPAWMRPLHLVDTGGRSIYKNIHDDGPIRHALCMMCYRTRGEFRKVHRRGYESCGGVEVLDSHFWEDDVWPEDTKSEDSGDGVSSDQSSC